MSHTNSMTKVDRRDAKLAMAHIYVAFIALLLGGLAGLLQVFVRSGQFTLPARHWLLSSINSSWCITRSYINYILYLRLPNCKCKSNIWYVH